MRVNKVVKLWQLVVLYSFLYFTWILLSSFCVFASIWRETGLGAS